MKILYEIEKKLDGTTVVERLVEWPGGGHRLCRARKPFDDLFINGEPNPIHHESVRLVRRDAEYPCNA